MCALHHRGQIDPAPSCGSRPSHKMSQAVLPPIYETCARALSACESQSVICKDRNSMTAVEHSAWAWALRPTRRARMESTMRLMAERQAVCKHSLIEVQKARILWEPR